MKRECMCCHTVDNIHWLLVQNAEAVQKKYSICVDPMNTADVCFDCFGTLVGPKQKPHACVLCGIAEPCGEAWTGFDENGAIAFMKLVAAFYPHVDARANKKEKSDTTSSFKSAVCLSCYLNPQRLL